MRFSKVEKIGFVSTWLILIAYFFMKNGMINATGLIYQGINLIGSVGIVYVSYKKSAKQPMILNIIWALIAVAAIGRFIL